MKLLWSLLFTVVLGCANTYGQIEQATLQIGVNADFSQGSMRVTNVLQGSPTLNMLDSIGQQGVLEANDIIVEVDNLPISSSEGFAKAINSSVNAQLQAIIIDHRTGLGKKWTISATPIANGKYAIARDTYIRKLRSEAVNGEVKELVRVNGNSVSNFALMSLRTVNSESKLSSQELLGDLLSDMAEIKDYVVASKERKWLDAVMVNKLEGIVAPAYEQILSQPLTEDAKQRMLINVSIHVTEELDRSFKLWARENGKTISLIAGSPSRILFRANTSNPSTHVELLTGADMILTLLQNGQKVNPLSPQGRLLLNNATHWRRLPQDEKASGYGNYYYRLVERVSEGNYTAQSFDALRKISILKSPENGEIFFP